MMIDIISTETLLRRCLLRKTMEIDIALFPDGDHHKLAFGRPYKQRHLPIKRHNARNLDGPLQECILRIWHRHRHRFSFFLKLLLEGAKKGRNVTMTEKI